MAKHDRDVLKLVMKLIGHKTGEISNVDYSPQKPKFPEINEKESSLPRSTPEEMGIKSSFVEELFRDLYENNSCHLHKAMVVRHGHVIGEFSPSPYENDVWHVTHSMCKSVTGMAIGLLISEGKLSIDDKLNDIFSKEVNAWQWLFSNSITVRHLLTMTSGVSFNESGTVSSNDWKKMFFESQQKNSPGTVFEYNSMNSYMLSAVVSKITGESMFDYLKPRLFDPLDIKRVFWEKCPQGITKGGWGMFLRLEDMAKLGLLYLNGGEYNGVRILSEEWVEEATKPHVETGKKNSPFYGYQLWCCDDREGSYTFNGMLGQNVYIYPDIDMMVVTNAGNDDLFQAGKMSELIRGKMSEIDVSEFPIEHSEKVVKEQRSLKHFYNEVKNEGRYQENKSGGWKNRKISMSVGKSRRVKVSFAGGRSNKTGDDIGKRYRKNLFTKISGCFYDMDDTGVGIMPLLMQVMHNNYTDGISSIGFQYDEKEDGLYLLIKEGENLHKIRCSNRYDPHYYDLCEHDETYRLSVITELSTDEYKRPVLRNEFCFVEDSTVKIMNIYFGKREPLQHDSGFDINEKNPPQFIGVRFDEIPGNSMMFGTMDQFGAFESVKGINGIVVNWLNEYGAMDALNLAIRDTVRPKLHGKLHVEVEKTVETEYDGIDGQEKEVRVTTIDNEAIMEDN